LKFIKITCLFVALVMALPLSAASARNVPDLVRALPEDTLACLYIRNLKSFQKQWKAHPLHKYAQKLLSGKVAPGSGKKVMQSSKKADMNAIEKSFALSFEEEMGIPLERLPDIFPGQWMVAWVGSDIEKFMEDKKNGKKDDIPVVFLMEHNGDIDTIVSMIRSSAAHDARKEGSKHRILEEKYLGASLYIEEVEKDSHVRDAGGYAITGRVLVMSNSIARLKDTIARLGNDHGPSLRDSARFSEAMDRVGRDGAYFYVDFTRPVQWIKKAARKINEKKTKKGQKANAPQMFSPELVLAGLHLESFAAAFIGIDPDISVSRIDSGLLLNDRKGLASLLQYGKGPLALPDYIPGNVVSARVTLFDLPAFLTRLEALVNSSAPLIGGIYNGYLAQLKVNTGVDIRESLLKNMGTGLSLINFAPDAQDSAPAAGKNPVSEVVCINISDRQGFTTAVEGIKTLIGGPDRFEKSTYLGYEIYTMKAPGQTKGTGQGFSYVICDDTFFFSYGSMYGLKKVLARVNRPEKTIWKTGPMKKAMKILPSGNVALSYIDVDQFIHAISTAAAFAEKNLAKNKKGMFAFKDIDKSSLPFCLISATYSEKKGIFSRAILLEKDK